MIQVIRLFWDICKLKANPQDLPKMQYLLISTILAGIIVDSFSAAILISKLTKLEITQTVVVYNLLLLLSVYLLLKLLGYSARGAQTVTAIAGSGLFISLVLLPALLVLNTANEATKSFAYIILIDNVWRILVNAHIFRHALSISF